MQYIDFTLLDVQTLQYPPRILAASFLFIVLVKRLRLFGDDEIIKGFPESGCYFSIDSD